MHWANERWVKVYTRDTPSWSMLSWKARGVFLLLLRAVDREGAIETGHSGDQQDHRDPLAGIAALLRMPLDELREAVGELQSAGCVTSVTARVTVTNFVSAQKTRSSDAERQRQSRERKQAKSGRVSHVVTAGHSVSRIEEKRIEEKRSDQDQKHSSAGADLDEAEQLFSLWNLEAHPDLPRAEKMTPGRRRAAKAALAQVPLQRWSQILAQLNGWAFARGENDRNWRASFDWLLGKDKLGAWNYLALLEGAKGAGPPRVAPAPKPEPVPSPPAAGTWWREAWDRIRDQGASPQTLRMLGQCEPNGDGRTVYAPSEIQADWITENLGPRLREVAGRQLEFKARAAS